MAILTGIVFLIAGAAGSITVFSQNYTELGSQPINVINTAYFNDQLSNITVGYSGNCIYSISNTTNNNGDMIIGGLVPSVNTTYTIVADINRTYQSSLLYLYSGSMLVTVQKHDSGSLRVDQHYTLPNGAPTTNHFTIPAASVTWPFNLTIRFDGDNQSYTSSIGSYNLTTALRGGSLPYPQVSGNLIRFYGYTGGSTSPETNVTLSVYSIEQTVPQTGNITAIGDTSLVSFGIDGPHEPDSLWIQSTTLVENAGGAYTIWVTGNGLGSLDQETVDTITALVDDKGYELGIHLSDQLNDLPLPEAYDRIDNDTQRISALFGRTPTSWCALQNEDNATHATYAYDHHGMIWRNGYMGVHEFPNIGNIANNSWPFWRELVDGGVTARGFTHETDRDPAIPWSLDWSKVQEFVNGYSEKNMTIAPFINWYKTGANTLEATFTESTGAGDVLRFTAHTNGYPALVEVDLPYGTYSITNSTSSVPVTYTQSHDGNIQFYVNDETTYTIRSGGRLPVAAFTADPVSGVTPLSVTFTDETTNAPVDWDWYWSDNETKSSDLQNPTATFGTGTYSVRLHVANGYGSDWENRTGYITVNPVVPAPCDLVPMVGAWTGSPADTAGLYQKSTGTFFLKNSNAGGDADNVFQYGAGGDDWSPLVGDWDGDGDDTAGLYQTSIGGYFVKNSNGPGDADLVFPYGAGGDDWIHLAGDWDGDGDDTVGAYQKSIGVFFLKNSNDAGNADLVFQYGAGGDDWSPLVGDWDGDGDDTAGLYQTSIGGYFVKNSNGPGDADLVFPYGAGGDDWIHLAGDWDGDGDDTVGAYQKSIGVFFLKNSNTYGDADTVFPFGWGCGI